MKQPTFFFMLNPIMMLLYILYVMQKKSWDDIILNARVVFPNFGHPALTSSFTNYTFLTVENRFATTVKRLSAFRKCFSFRILIYYFHSMTTASIYKAS